MYGSCRSYPHNLNPGSTANTPMSGNEIVISEALIQDFLTESFEGLEQTERDLVTLEQTPDDHEILGRIFRCLHSLKGSCGFFGYSTLEKVAHKGENILSKLRNGEAELTEDKATILLQMADAISEMLNNIQETGTEGENSYSELIAELERCESGQPATIETQAATTGQVVEKPAEAPPAANSETSVAEKEMTPLEIQQLVCKILMHTNDDDKPQPEEKQEQKQVAKKTTEIEAPTKVDTTIRVSVNLIDKLMNLVGELVLARNQTLQYCNVYKDRGFVATTQRLNLVTTELQESVMQTRMQPIGNVWNKFPRLIRDLAKSTEKQIQLEMEGKSTELDKTLIEAIKDPLTHLLRNSCDHGLEAPEDRKAAGKPEQGTVYLRAFHEGGQVIIEIEDDGRGVDVNKIKDKALEKNLVNSQQLERMSDREALDLIFRPGFSTAAKVTNVSGRGVGMDVVKTNIESIGGTVDIKTELGKYTKFKIKIPLTLAIIPALTISCGQDYFAIPQVSLVELVRIENSDSKNTIEWIDDTPIYRLRDKLLPIVYLTQQLQLNSEHSTELSEEYSIVVLQADNHQFGLVVDDVHETEEIVVKPLGKQLMDIDAFAGATIMGDGKVVLILDVLALAKRAGLGLAADNKDLISDESLTEEALTKSNKQSILICTLPDQQRIAVPLNKVARLEEFASDKLESIGRRRVIQYRGRIMPLYDIAETLSISSSTQNSEQETQQVIVHNHQGNSFGVIVGQIEDIIQERVDIDTVGRRNGTIGSAIVQGQVVEFLDVEKLLQQTIEEAKSA